MNDKAPAHTPGLFLSWVQR